MILSGTALKLGDNIDTDVIIAGRYLILRDLDEAGKHVLEGVIPDFASKIKYSGIIVAGKNFGCGSSREAAPMMLKYLGTKVVVAESFARIFFRNSINLGLPLLECKDVSQKVRDGDALQIDLLSGIVANLSTGLSHPATKLPDFLLEMLEAGGALELLKRKSET
ncbi:3-isopropylmalate dehydratase small subunit [Candidatus Bathyarchaeota archaeon]|nr:3-isopropylmalate dehydratase small subunit [Candidatus Bathyarchaeota archaeon]